MSYSYLVEEIEITRQAGNTGSVQFIAPEVIDMDDFEVWFSVTQRDGGVLMSKTPDDITVSGQTITIPLDVDDTKGRAGVYRWEMEIESTDETITLGKGKFIILPEIIQR